MKYLGVLFMLSNFQLAQAETVFTTAKTSNVILSYLISIPQNSIIFVDIDDTIYYTNFKDL